MDADNEKELVWTEKLYALQENETWLNEQVKEGLVLKKFDDKYATFSKEEPKDISYKIVILNPKDAEKQIKIIERQGYTFVTDYKEYYIFYIKGRYGQFQPRLNAEVIEFARKWFNKQILKGFALSILALLPFLIDPLMKHNQILQIIVETPIVFYFSFLSFFIYSFIKGLIKYKTIIRCRKCFLEHETYIKRNKPVFLKVMDKVFWIFFISAIAIGAYMIYSDNSDKKLPLSAAYNDMPFVFYEDVEKSEENEIEQEESTDIDRHNYVRLNSTLLAPKQYFANQGSYEMYTHYYELRFKWLIKLLAKELIKTDIYHINNLQYKEIDYDGFDLVYISKEERQKNIAVSKGKKVMIIEYHGDQPVEKILAHMAEVL